MPVTHLTAPLPRRWLRRLVGGAVAVVVAVGVASCSTPAPSQDELTEALVASGLSEEVAECTAEALTASLSESELAAIAERGAGGAPVDDPKVEGESADELVAAMSACRELQIASQPTTTTSPVEPEGGAAGSSTVVAPGTDDAELKPASTTTTAP